MPTSQNQRDLFRNPSTVDQLNLLLSLSESKDLTSDLTLALINIIRAELEQPQKQNPFAYRRYSEVTHCLNRQTPELYEQVVHAWRQRRCESLATDSPLRSLIQELLKAEEEALEGAETKPELEQAKAKKSPSLES